MFRSFRVLGFLVVAGAAAALPDSFDRTVCAQQPGPAKWGLVKVNMIAKDTIDASNSGSTIREYTYTPTTYSYKQTNKDGNGKVILERHFVHTFSVPPRELVEGQSFDVTVTGKAILGGPDYYIGTNASASGYGGLDLIEQSITIDGKPSKMIHRQTYLGNFGTGVWEVKESVAKYRATVPTRDKAQRKIGINFNSGSPSLGSSLVRYEYELDAKPIDVPGGGTGSTPSQVKQEELEGLWHNKGQSEIRFTKTGDTYSGRYVKVRPESREYGFTEGEENFRNVTRTGPNTFKGELKLRYKDGRIIWLAATLTINGDHMKVEYNSATVVHPEFDWYRGAATGSGSGGETGGSGGGGTAGSSGHPWETAEGRDCFEKWITLATNLLNKHDGGAEHNGRKPWSFNKYGLIEGSTPAGPKSVRAPDDFPQYGNDKYRYMWYLYETDAWGKFVRAPAMLNAAGVPPLRDYVRRCSPASAGNSIPGEGMVLVAPDVTVPRGASVLVMVRLLRARDITNMDFEMAFEPNIAVGKPPAERGAAVLDIFQSNLPRPGNFKFNFASLTPFNGDGSVGGFRFDATGPGRSRTPLTLSVANVRNSRGERLPISVVHGSITIYDPADRNDPNNPNNPYPPGGGGANTNQPQPTCSGTGRQTVADAQCCLKMWVELTPRQAQMDVNGDGVIDSSDAVQILRNVTRGLAR